MSQCLVGKSFKLAALPWKKDKIYQAFFFKISKLILNTEIT